jgi:hypothetical protein
MKTGYLPFPVSMTSVYRWQDVYIAEHLRFYPCLQCLENQKAIESDISRNRINENERCAPFVDAAMMIYLGRTQIRK